MADVESLKQNILDTNFDYSTLGRSHFKGTYNEMEMAKNELKFNEYQSRQDKLYDLAKMELEMQYNSAAAQKHRFLEAGINPYLALTGDGASAGSVSAGSSPSSHGVSGLASAVAAGRQADAARFNAITSAAGQLNDSVSSFYKNRIMNQQAQQEEFKTAHQAENFRVDLQNKIADLEGKKNKSDIDVQTLNALKLAYQKSLATFSEDVQTPRLQNDLLRSQYAKIKSDQSFVESQTKTEDLMRDIRFRAAEQQIKLTKAQEYQLYAQASKLFIEAQAVGRELQYMNDFGYRFRGDKEYGESSTIAENLMRLRSSSEDFLRELKNRSLISAEEYSQAVQRTKMMNTQAYWNNYMHGQEGFGSQVVGGLNMLTEVFGNIFGGAMMRNVIK